MRIQNVLYFAPALKFTKNILEDREKMIDAFQKRVAGFYLKPAKNLLANESLFACGILCLVTIDCLARLKFNGKMHPRMKQFLKEYNFGIPEEKLDHFIDMFRNGLIHEGRVKHNGWFSLDCNSGLLHIEEEIMVVNPGILLLRTESALNLYIADLRKNSGSWNMFIRKFQEDFKEELKFIEKQSLSI